ncbi:hypothetical protein PROFUN_00434 [Planoprotostelium fungivorum]|uniref:At4g15545-like C-terminal domain-containing protein n=1 Tax=Planoprotostelium fungivorum TaxID=1890364 RepID=A0A2P6N0W0_9EUKA|nr:hypothetical protein PROFUN_00434 [Planoprotostelium fungivorum]
MTGLTFRPNKKAAKMNKSRSEGEPDDVLEQGIQIIRDAYNRKTSAMDKTIDNLRSVIRERENIAEGEASHDQLLVMTQRVIGLEARIARLEQENQEILAKYRNSIEEKNRAVAENLELNQELRRLRRDAAKLQAFRQAIITTVDEDENGEPITAPAYSNTPVSPIRGSSTDTPDVNDDVDEGKAFFREARQSLSPAGFSQLVTQVKRLNSQLQNMEETLEKSKPLFGDY